MPKASKTATLARQWEMLQFIPSRPPGKTAGALRAELATAGHEVSKRTIERDLVELASIFPLKSNQISKPHGWYWSRDIRLGIPGIELAEAVSLGLLEDVLKNLISPGFLRPLKARFDEARRKLQSLPGNDHRRWTDLVRYLPPGLPFLPADVSPAILREVQDALLRQKPLLAEYRPAGGSETKQLTLHPLALLQQGARMYLLATAFEYDDPAHYAIHRLESVVAQPGESRVPAGYSLERWLAQGRGQFGGGDFIDLEATLSESLAGLLTETPLSENQRIALRDGVHHLSATVSHSWQLQFWILSQGAAIVITKPTALRTQILEKIQNSLAAYETGRPAEY